MRVSKILDLFSPHPTLSIKRGLNLMTLAFVGIQGARQAMKLISKTKKMDK